MIQTEDSVEILEVPGQAEGESGSETIGFSTFGAQRINDAQKRRARPCSVRVIWNKTTLAPQQVSPIPPAYWGTFITLFNGTIIAGARNDGLGSTFARWGQNSADYRISNGAGGTAGFQTYNSTILGLPGSLCGFDVFFKTTATDIFVQATTYNIYTGVSHQQRIVLLNVPQIGTYVYPGAPAGTPPYMIIRRRPEGYLPGEDGAQVFLSLPFASGFPILPGFVDPATIGVPVATFDAEILTNITP